MREGLGFELCRREIVAPLVLASASALDAGLDHADHGQMGKAQAQAKALPAADTSHAIAAADQQALKNGPGPIRWLT